jgi:hypothetical protein
MLLVVVVIVLSCECKAESRVNDGLTRRGFRSVEGALKPPMLVVCGTQTLRPDSRSYDYRSYRRSWSSAVCLQQL